MTEEIIIDGVNVAGCHNKTHYKNDYGDVQCKCYRFEDIENDTFLLGICKQHPNCYYKQLKRLEQENEELSKLIRDTKDYAEVCSVCKDEVTIYPNISGRTDYTQNEVECRTLAQIITRKNNLEQENKDLKIKLSSTKCYLCGEGFLTPEGAELYDEKESYRSALEEIRVIAYRGAGGDDCTFCHNIYNKINEILN